VLSALLASAPAYAADADLTAVAPAGAGAFAAGSASSSSDLRSGVIGRWNPGRGAFDWLWRLDAGPATLDTLSDVVPAGDAVFAIGSANGALTVAKLDAATGTLQRSCGGSGSVTHSFGPAFVAGRAVESGGRMYVAGGTLEFPSHGLIAAIDESTCAVVDSAKASGATDATGFAAVDAAPDGTLVVSGFAGMHAALYRFDPELHQLGSHTYAASGAFSDVKATGSQAVAVASSTLQCATLSTLAPDCGTETLGVSGSVLAPRPSGGWLVAGSLYGSTTGLQPAVAPYSAALDPDAQSAFNAFGAVPALFTDLASSSAGLVGGGESGYIGSRTPFLYTAGKDGGAPVFTPLPDFDDAAPAPVQPAPDAPPPAGPAAPAPRTAAPPPATARFSALRTRPKRDGTFGTLTLRCATACSARGTIRARYTTIGKAAARLRAGQPRRLPLRIDAAGRRMLARHGTLAATVRFAVGRQVFQERLTLTTTR
jgi:hypothetical protein